MPRPRIAVLVALALQCLAISAAAQPPQPAPNLGPPLLLQLEGVLARTRPAANAAGFTAASFVVLGEPSGTTRWLGVTKARTVGGDHPADGKDVLNALAPFVPNLLVTGPADLVARLREAPDGSSVRLEGLVDRSSRTYLLRSVEVGD
jgi:hypothetical protein